MNFSCLKKRKIFRKSYNRNRRNDDTQSLLSEYAENSTIHGVRYLTEPKRPLIERIWWIIAFAVSLYGCGTLIIKIWDKWDETPVIVSFADRTTPIWQIPFPAMTICPQIKTKSKFFNFTEKFLQLKDVTNSNNITEIEADKLKAINHVCSGSRIKSTLLDEKFTGKNCVKNIQEMAPPMKDVILLCLWESTHKYQCDELFTEILTDIGICYTFNILQAEVLYRQTEIQKEYNYYSHTKKVTNWTHENGYSNELTLPSYPKRVITSNRRNAFELHLGAFNYDTDYLCSGRLEGFKILFHTPNDIPQFRENYHHIFLDKKAYFTLKPKITVTSNGLKDYSPNERKCFFNEDRYLRFFKVYTQQNCELECLANYTMSKCGCVKFSMPTGPGTPICGLSSIDCYLEAEHDLDVMQQKQFLRSNKMDDKLKHGHTDCDCLPTCTSIVYGAEITQFQLNYKNIVKAYKHDFYDNFPGIKISQVSIFFQESQFTTIKRSELYGSTDFVANSGGLLGLFMGISVLSIVEIFFYCSIRLLSHLRRKEKNRMNPVAVIEYIE